MKWVFLIATLAAIKPFSLWLRRNPRATPKTLMVIGFLPFAVDPLHLYMAIINGTGWPGYVSGAEFSVLDALVIAVYLSLPASPRPLPFRLSMGLYFVAVMLAIFQARVPVAAAFYPWQLARMFIVYAVVAQAVRASRPAAPALMTGMAAGLIMEAGIAIWQRFGLGIFQVNGTFFAQNQLGLISHFIVFPFFALLLSGARQRLLPLIVVLAGIIVETLTASRATIGIAGFGFVLVFMLSATRQWTNRKMLVLLTGISIMAILTPQVLYSLAQRNFVNSEASSDYERETLLKAAEMMLSDHPLGIGPNQFVMVANIDGYNQRAGVLPNSRSSIVHNSYWLAAVETGYFGLVTFIILLLGPLMLAFLCGWRFPRDTRGDLLLGLGTALLAVYIHAYFEWIFYNFQTQYIFAMDVALVVGLAQQLEFWRSYGTGLTIRPFTNNLSKSHLDRPIRFIFRSSSDRWIDRNGR